MRPIDADELIKKNIEDMRAHTDFMTVVILSTFNEMLVNEPEIRMPDAKPERRGEWIYGEYDIPHCSECGIHPKEISRYCPHCGATMDGG